MYFQVGNGKDRGEDKKKRGGTRLYTDPSGAPRVAGCPKKK